MSDERTELKAEHDRMVGILCDVWSQYRIQRRNDRGQSGFTAGGLSTLEDVESVLFDLGHIDGDGLFELP